MTFAPEPPTVGVRTAAAVAALDDPTPDPGAPDDDRGGRHPVLGDRMGRPGGRPLVLIHGVTASARIWWRVGPALAADRPAGRRGRTCRATG